MTFDIRFEQAVTFRHGVLLASSFVPRVLSSPGTGLVFNSNPRSRVPELAARKLDVDRIKQMQLDYVDIQR